MTNNVTSPQIFVTQPSLCREEEISPSKAEIVGAEEPDEEEEDSHKVSLHYSLVIRYNVKKSYLFIKHLELQNHFHEIRKQNKNRPF